MRKKREIYPAFHAGASLLLVIFIILCLVILATLSLSSALRDETYATKEAQKTEEYYQADAAAVRVLQQIDQNFLSICEGGSSSPEGMIEALSKETYPDARTIQFSKSELSASCLQADYTVLINGRQSLAVCILLDPKQELAENSYEIRTWKEISSVKWEGNDSLPLMTQ